MPQHFYYIHYQNVGHSGENEHGPEQRQGGASSSPQADVYKITGFATF